MRKILSVILVTVVLLSCCSCGGQIKLGKDNPELDPEAVQADIIKHASLEYTALANPDVLRIDTWERSTKAEAVKGGLLIAYFNLDSGLHTITITEDYIEVYKNTGNIFTEGTRYYVFPEEVAIGMIAAIRQYKADNPDGPFHRSDGGY